MCRARNAVVSWQGRLYDFETARRDFSVSRTNQTLENYNAVSSFSEYSEHLF